MAQMMRAGLYRPVHVKTLKLYSHHVDLAGRLSAAMRHDIALPNVHSGNGARRLMAGELKTRA
jgi:hypothetical protein